MLFIYLTSGLFLGWSLGANDAANIFGSAVGTRMVKFRTAAIVASIFVIIGAVVQGAGASHTLGKLGSVDALAGAFTVALAAALTVYWMTKLKLPVSTSQAIVGAIIGWNLYSGKPTDYNSLVKIVTTWVAGPILGAIFAILLFLLLNYSLKKSKIHLVKLDAYIRIALIVVGAFGAYSLGANNIANVMGVFVSLAPDTNLDFGIFTLNGVQQLFLLGGIAISVGIFTYSRRVMETVGNELLELTTEAALVVVLAESLVLFVFSSQSLSDFVVSLGLPPIPLVPVSSSQVIVGAIIGIGLLKGVKNMRFKILGSITSGWVTTPVIAGIVSFLSLFIVNNVFKLEVYAKEQPKTEHVTEIKKENIVMPVNKLKQKQHNDISIFFYVSIAVVSAIGVTYFVVKRKNYIEKQKIEDFKRREQISNAEMALIENELKIAKLESKRLEKELEYKNKELTSMALNIVHKNEFLKKLINQIENIKKKYNDEDYIRDLDKISHKINEYLQLDKDRETLQLNIEKNNKEFLSNLMLKYPDLTQNEKKLASLIRLNLSSKEIASILNISPKSVEMNRYRLRKKIGVPSDETLVSFIKKI